MVFSVVVLSDFLATGRAVVFSVVVVDGGY
jgi:hypothetical protein